MAHYAKVEDGLVTSVLVVPDDETDGQAYLHSLGLDGVWIQTSYNTRGNVHYDGGTALRYNYAGIGYLYDEVRDAFVAPEPEPFEGGEWVLDDESLVWVLVEDGS